MSGLLGIMMELFNVFPNLLATIGDIVGNIARGSNDEDDEEEDDEEGSTDGLFAEEADEENDEEMEEEDGSGDEQGGLFDPLLNMLASIFPTPTRNGDEMADEDGSGSGDGEEEEVDNDIHIGVDVEPGSLLDIIINLIPGEEERDENAEDTTEMDGAEVTTLSPEEGGPTFGGISVSLAPIDLANIFVQVKHCC